MSMCRWHLLQALTVPETFTREITCGAGVKFRTCDKTTTTFRNVPPHTYMVQHRPGFSVRLHHNTFDTKSENSQVGVALQRWRPTHAANAQLLVDTATAEEKVMRAWVDQGLQPGNTTKTAMSRHQPKDTRTNNRTLCEERIPRGAEFQIAAIEVCSSRRISLGQRVQHL